MEKCTPRKNRDSDSKSAGAASENDSDFVSERQKPKKAKVEKGLKLAGAHSPPNWKKAILDEEDRVEVPKAKTKEEKAPSKSKKSKSHKSTPMLKIGSCGKRKHSSEEDKSFSDKSDADIEAALEEAQNMSLPPSKKKSKTKKKKTTSSFPGSEAENERYKFPKKNMLQRIQSDPADRSADPVGHYGGVLQQPSAHILAELIDVSIRLNSLFRTCLEQYRDLIISDPTLTGRAQSISSADVRRATTLDEVQAAGSQDLPCRPPSP